MKQMKRVVSITLALTMILSMFSINFISASAADTTAPLLGDVDRDGRITIYDAAKIQRSLAKFPGELNYNEMDSERIEFKIADVDGDKKITIYDVSLIQRYIASSDAVKAESAIGKPISTDVEPTDAPTQPVTDEPTEEPTTAPTDAPGELEDGYYLIGVINGVENWATVDAANKLEANPGAEGEYMVHARQDLQE